MPSSARLIFHKLLRDDAYIVPYAIFKLLRRKVARDGVDGLAVV